MENFKNRILEVFTKYVQIESGSDENSQSSPSTKGQLELAEVLKKDLQALGLKDVNLSRYGYLTATLPANTERKVPVIGFLAHMDTYPGGTAGRTVKPIVHKNYQGGDIVVSKEHNVIISPKTSPALNKCIGHDIVTASGDTLLGADDKAGITIIMVMLEHLIKNPQIKHGEIKIAFTPDEEIARGTKHFDVKAFGADFAYTLDGECGDGITSENFNAAAITIKVKGVQAHPGNAKDIMQNPVRIIADICASWPENKLPETTCGREGFVCFIGANADFEKGTLNAMARDFDEALLQSHLALLEAIIKEKRLKYPGSVIDFEVSYPYKNMKPMIDKHPQILKLAKEAFEECGLNAESQPIRGGTDGANLSYMGLPTPNIDAGYGTPHGPFEWTSLDMMDKIARAIAKIAENNAK